MADDHGKQPCGNVKSNSRAHSPRSTSINAFCAVAAAAVASATHPGVQPQLDTLLRRPRHLTSLQQQQPTKSSREQCTWYR